MNTEHLLIEIGCEELPPKGLQQLAQAFAAGVTNGLAEHGLGHGEVQHFASPRRLAILVEGLQLQAAGRDREMLGPPAQSARDQQGQWTKAALGFAAKHQVSADELAVTETAKGPRLAFRSVSPGAQAVECLGGIIETSLNQLPAPRRMRWGAARTEFIRPVRWVVVLLGDKVVPCRILGQAAGNQTQGHRVHSNTALALGAPQEYAEVLMQAKVMASFEQRRERIRQQVQAQATSLNGAADIDPELLDEVTALVEWPQALSGNFEESFLQLPPEVLVHVMKQHQKYFPVVDGGGHLLPHFITVANLESKDSAQVIDGNERVIRPRLGDAEFFFQSDRKTPLAERIERLKGVTFQQKLGSLYDKTQRLAGLGAAIAEDVGAQAELVQRAALLSKTDLVTQMVGEFAGLQGTAGRYYALHDGEHPAVAQALEQHYWPRHSGAELPGEPVAMTLAVADRIDTLVGIFGIDQAPTGSRDPFALRRAALGVLRIIVEGELELDLRHCIEQALRQYPAGLLREDTAAQVLAYLVERFRAWYEDERIAVEVFKAVAAKDLSQPLDIHRRVLAVDAFTRLPQAKALAAANKRVSNILEGQAADFLDAEISKDLLREPAEQLLAEVIESKAGKLAELLASGRYTELLASLAELQAPIDSFFDQVMVMTDDPALRNNRLRLLRALRDSFLQVADISQLVIGK